MSKPADGLQKSAAMRGSRLRFPRLLALVVLLFLVDLVLPDFIPFIDEILLGLFAAILACLRERSPPENAVVEPDSERLPPGQS